MCMEVVGTANLKVGYKWMLEKEDGLYLPFVDCVNEHVKYDPNFSPYNQEEYCHCFATIRNAFDYLKAPYTWNMFESNQEEIYLTLYTVTGCEKNNCLVGLYNNDIWMISFQKVKGITPTNPQNHMYRQLYKNARLIRNRRRRNNHVYGN